jgi:ureidoglycolate hydrolase
MVTAEAFSAFGSVVRKRMVQPARLVVSNAASSKKYFFLILIFLHSLVVIDHP